MEHALDTEEEFLQSPLFHRPASAHRLVVVLANVGEDATVWGSEARWDPPSCSDAVFGPCSRTNLVHLLPGL